ncbi:hypothetical protein LEP1GSC043_1389 [Leptospira weilii str. Ecochallenge]|uniref:Uncharacterized protein n=1 Tax=Leptospira weilii str. Ecochallenge TaxID=1049986 RepID=N1U828_9LEPT|nr:hypothetical protein LEP1GSC043_1389 [Leptospira weilii str. Ecochallenge]
MGNLHNRFQKFQKTIWFNIFCYFWTGFFLSWHLLQFL